MKPPVLMADEPTGNLDSVNGTTGAGTAALPESAGGNHVSSGDARSGAGDSRGPDHCASGRAGSSPINSEKFLSNYGEFDGDETVVAHRGADRMARDAGIARKVFVCRLAVGAGVGALTGYVDSARASDSMLTSEARTVMAADLTARQFVMPNDAQTAALDQLAQHGVERTLITETVSMTSSTAATPLRSWFP